jgi:hypothetical protein
MTNDKIRELAQEAGFRWGFIKAEGLMDGMIDFANLVAQHEREACAKVCDDINAKYKWPEDTAERVASQWCADSIRARGQA